VPYTAQPYSAYPYLAQPILDQPIAGQAALNQATAAPPSVSQTIPQQYAYQPYSAQPYSVAPYPGQPIPQPYSAVPSPYGQPVSAYPYGPYQFNPWEPTPIPARRPGAALRVVGSVLALVLVLSVVGVGVVVGYADYSGALDTRAAWRPAAGPKVELPPAQNAPAAEWTQWARSSVSDELTAQAKALLSANEDGYLAAVDPDNAKLVQDHQRRFKVLHAMGPGVWTQDVAGALKDRGARSWKADIKISYCFGAATCSAVELVESSTWELKGDHLLMVALEQSDPGWNGPRPWETDELTVQVGKRVVMAATKTNAWRLPDAVKSADKAAAIADTLAKWSPAPARYVIFLAGPNDWKRWYGHSQPEWAAAWAVPVGDTATEVVVRTEVVQQRGLETLLTHELTHVTTLAGKRDGAGASAWWLIEGIADYATMIGKAVNTYDALPPTKAFVRGKWDGDPAVDAPSVNAPLEEASARYGVAFLAVRRISDKYSQDKMLDFWGRVVHDNQDLNAASTAALGTPWATVKADCAKFVRTSMT
jgi:hypothetical protein